MKRSTNLEPLSSAQLRAEIMRLGPWHLEVQVTPEVSTRCWLDASHEDLPATHQAIEFYNPRLAVQEIMRRTYPDGLHGRAVMDCACNNGAYLFSVKGLDAGDCFGFDVRQHWIDQAEWLREHCVTVPTKGMRFEVGDLYDVPRRGLEAFDITFFTGLFYHLPDPIRGLKIAADLTSELMVVNTATRFGVEDGYLAVDEESKSHLLSGVYGLNWLPTGPAVLERILRWAGFCDVINTWWFKEVGPPSPPGTGRLEMLASKVPGLLDGFRRWGVRASP